jgi:hypothetical protein
MRIFVDAVGVLAPGLPDWECAKSVLAGSQSFVATTLPPIAPTSLQPAERRRSSPTVRLALAAAEQALQQTEIAAADMAMVFSSYEAAGVITHQLCEVLAGSREVSPTQFHNSVHNAPSGYYSIAMGARLSASSVCRGEWSFAAGLLNAAVQSLTDDVAVMYVCYDSPLPAPMSEVMPMIETTAIALVLTPAATARALGAWEIDVVPGDRALTWPEWMPATWHANACARGFATLATLADPVGRVAIAPLSPELRLRVSRC